MNNKLYFTVGPSELYPTVPQHVQSALDEKIGVITHRGKQFEGIYKNAVDGLRTLLDVPADYHIFFLSSATEIWERIIENCVENTSFHCVNGSFSKRFYEFSSELGKKAYLEKADFGKGFYPDKIDVPADTEIICLTCNETSSGVSMPVEDINKFRAKNKEALIFVDAVSALPFPILDFSKIDSTFFSVQKCFGLPAGLGVWIVNQRCMDKADSILKKGKSIGTYHTLPSMLSKGKDNQTPETPNVWNIYLLSKVVADFNKKGADVIRKETAQKAKMLYDYIGSSQTFSYAVEEPAHRSFTTIVANTKIPASEINKKLDAFDMSIGSGYSSYKDTQVRIANFPAISVEQMEKLVKTLKELFN